jgi:hypothetical protein
VFVDGVGRSAENNANVDDDAGGMLMAILMARSGLLHDATLYLLVFDGTRHERMVRQSMSSSCSQEHSSRAEENTAYNNFTMDTSDIYLSHHGRPHHLLYLSHHSQHSIAHHSRISS